MHSRCFCSGISGGDSGDEMKVLYLWIEDYCDNMKQINEQLVCQFPKYDKIVLVYEEKYVWEMGEK